MYSFPLNKAILYKFRQISLLNQDKHYSDQEIFQLHKLLDKEYRYIKDSKENIKEDIFLQNLYKFLEKIFLKKLTKKKTRSFRDISGL